ncbi:MAG: LemA family protein [Novosphingobium sp.]|uniref:LemA family protein n=1 Tax=Novosphingobium sp. TaxID=1874826 RepID=UPI002735FF3B|nr:LemA family protein [Novosphingobium sp.]MDP3550810.1 LemA family protein [Novosphingobium sp.]
METALWIVGSILGAILLIALMFYSRFKSTYNRLVALDQRCETAFSDVDVHLKHRHNLIPGLVGVLKGSTAYEKEMLFGVMEARNEALRTVSMPIRIKAEGKLTAQLNTLISSFDKFPDMKAMPEFARLRQELVDCENRITAARRFHNLAIEEYNTATRQFPGTLVAQKLRMNTRQPFDLGVERVLVDEPVAIAF